MTEAMDDATRAQVAAAAPDVSTWLSANAGSGKTRVLTDRVARLLADEVPPERILCLTYTKAAAMEMQNRLFERLGEWAMMPEDELRDALAMVGVPTRASDARSSVARAHALRARHRDAGRAQDPDDPFLLRLGPAPLPARGRREPGLHRDRRTGAGRLIADLLDELAEDPARRDAIDAVVPYLGDEDGIMKLARAVAGEAEALRAAAGLGRRSAPAMGIDPGLTRRGAGGRADRRGARHLRCGLAALDPEKRSRPNPPPCVPCRGRR
jgi:ATP-dependent helicase/nuclease subunit A